MANSHTIGMTTNTITRHKQHTIDHRPILAVKMAVEWNTRLAIVFDLFSRFSPTTRTKLSCVFLFRNDNPHETALTALNLVIFHID
jgi:hypothetical protein